MAAIEAKAVAAPSATLVIGYLTGLLIEVVPWLKDNLTADQKTSLPIILAFLASLIAAYFAPHTHRPDLMTVVEQAVAEVPEITGAGRQVADVPLPKA